jgi:hypothetical protein
LAEQTVARDMRQRVTAEVRRAIPPDDWIVGSPPADSPHYIALMLYREFCSSSIAVHAIAAPNGLADGAGERQAQVRLMRCIFGNPFRPISFESRRLGCPAVSLAQSIYDDRALDRLLELAQALEKAGCHDAEILAHCRRPGPHVRGCWVVDLLLGKE